MEFKDVSHLPDAAGRADPLPEWRQELERMGFSHLGYLEERIPEADISGLLATLQGKHDQDFASQKLANGHVTELMTSPGEMASVELECFFESQLLTFRTVLENGVVIETGMRPARLPERRDAIQPLRDALEAKPIQKFINLVMGGPDWGMYHRPMAGYLCEYMTNPAPQKLWLRHKQRIEVIAKKHQARIPPQNDMSLVFATILRRQHINQFQERLIARGEMAIFIVLLLVLAVFFISIGSDIFGLGFKLPREIVLILGISTFFIALFGVAWPLRIATIFARCLPWPRIQPLATLLQALPVEENGHPASFRREYEGGTADVSLFMVLQNVNHLKQVLSKEDQPWLAKWFKGLKRRRKRHQPEPQKIQRIYQRYERLLCAELKLRGIPSGPNAQWPKFWLKTITGVGGGILLGMALRQAYLPETMRGNAGILLFIGGFIGAILVDGLFGFLFAITLYSTYVFDQHGLWIGLAFAGAYALFWQFIQQKRKFKQSLKAVKERYDL
jgi:hypothetical protein